MDDEIAGTLYRIEEAFSSFARDQQSFNEKLLKLLGEIKDEAWEAKLELSTVVTSLSEAVTALQSLDDHFTRHDDDDWPGKP